MEVWVGASSAGRRWGCKEEGPVCAFCLSLSICVLWYVHRRLAERLHSENNCTGIEGERNAVLTVTPNVFRGNLQLEAHKVGISGEGEKSPRTHRCGGSRDRLLSPALSPLCLPSLIGTGFGMFALPALVNMCPSQVTKQTEWANTLWGDLTQQPEPPPSKSAPRPAPKTATGAQGWAQLAEIYFSAVFCVAVGKRERWTKTTRIPP